jgi:prophage regulatory protein
LKPENVHVLAVNEAKASTAIADSGLRFLSDKDVAHRYSLSRSTIWRWLKTNPNFPKPVRPSNGATRWRVADLDAFDDALGGHYRTKAPDGISAADLARQPSAKPSQQASDGGGNRKRRRR